MWEWPVLGCLDWPFVNEFEDDEVDMGKWSGMAGVGWAMFEERFSYDNMMDRGSLLKRGGGILCRWYKKGR